MGGCNICRRCIVVVTEFSSTGYVIVAARNNSFSALCNIIRSQAFRGTMVINLGSLISYRPQRELRYSVCSIIKTQRGHRTSGTTLT